MRSREFLEPPTGLYSIAGCIALDSADWLTLTRSNGACEQLWPGHRGTFTLPDDNYFRLEFRGGASSAVEAMLFHAANVVYYYVIDR